MVTLALDTSHPVGSAALARDGAVTGVEKFREPSTHLVALAEAVDRLLASRSLTPAGINRLAVVTGPGSFTGLRIGLAFAKGLHASRGIPLVTIDALRLLALPWLDRHERVCAMIDARRGEVYAALFERASGPAMAPDPTAARELALPRAGTPAAWLDSLPAGVAVFVGTGAFAHRELIHARVPDAAIASGDDMYPSTSRLASMAHRMTPLEESAVRTLEPFYLRASGAEQVRLRAHARRTEGHDG